MPRFTPHSVSKANHSVAPPTLQRYAMSGMFLLVLLSFASVNLQALLWQTSDWLVGTILPAVVVDLTNQERQAVAAAPLRRNATLDEAARLKAEHMAAEEYFAHFSPSGVTPWHWFGEAGYSFVHAGENLAIHFSDSSEVVTAWMNSPTHRDNIVDPKYLEIGVGTARGMYQGYETVFVVQLFGAPAAEPVADSASVAVAPAEESALVATSATAATAVESAEQVAGASEPAPATTTPTSTLAAAPSTPTAPVTPMTTRDVPTSPLAVAATEEIETTAVAEATPTGEAEVVAVEVTDELVSVYSSVLTTSTPLIPATLDGTYASNAGTSAPVLARLATQPSTVLQVLYLIMAGLVGGVLFTSVMLEWRRHHPLQVAYGVLLLCVMSGLFYTHIALTSGAQIV